MPTIKVLDVGVTGTLQQSIVETMPDATAQGQLLIADQALKFVPGSFLMDSLGNILVDNNGEIVTTTT